MALKKVKPDGVAVHAGKLESERSQSAVLRAENNALKVANADLVDQISSVRSALDARDTAAADAEESLRVQLADAHARLDGLSADLAQARSDLTAERSESAASLASKTQDAETISGLRDEVKDLQAKLFRIRDAVKEI